MTENNQIGEENQDVDLEIKYNEFSWNLEDCRISTNCSDWPKNEEEFNDIIQNYLILLLKMLHWMQLHQFLVYYLNILNKIM